MLADINSETQVLNAGVASTSKQIPQGRTFLIVKNAGSFPVFVSLTDGAAAVFPTDIVPQDGSVILPGCSEPYSATDDQKRTVAAITLSGSSVIYIQASGGK